MCIRKLKLIRENWIVARISGVRAMFGNVVEVVIMKHRLIN